MRIFLHDYAGHPFQAELSRVLAARGHCVTHAYFAGDMGPKGEMRVRPGDPSGLAFLPVSIGPAYSKTDFLRRRRGDRLYGRAVGEAIAADRPDVVISGNTPTEAQELIQRAACRADVPFIYWCQDFYSIAASRLLARKLPGPGHLIGAWYRRLERRQMRRAAHVLHITEAFRAQTDRWGIPAERVSVIPNWGPLDEIVPGPRDNPWAAEHGLHDGPRFVYSGTLALKHNPALLSGLARACPEAAEVIVIAAGVGAEALRREVSAGLPRLRCLPLQPFGRFAEVLAAADVQLAVIEREAGAFSVPSKILSYLCSGRPIVLAAPADNLAAAIVRDSGAGVVVEPEDVAGFAAAALAYARDTARAAAAGQAGRAYAEAQFDLGRIAIHFEALFGTATGAIAESHADVDAPARSMSTETDLMERVA